MNIPEGFDYVELRIFSNRNQNITKLTDISELDPDKSKLFDIFNRNILYPIVDIQLQDEMEGVLLFSHVLGGTWAINPMYYPERSPMALEVVIPVAKLDWWDNWFHYSDPHPTVEDFYIRKRYRNIKGSLNEQIELLTENWSGKLSIYGYKSGVITKVEESTFNSQFKFEVITDENQDHAKRSIIKALKNSIEYVLKSQDLNPNSPLYKGMYLFYDYDARTYRQKNWLWTYGPVIKGLIDASKIPQIAEKFSKEKLYEVASDLGDVAIKYQENDKSKPYYGLLMCRYDHSFENCLGYEEKYSPADGLFLVGWGWIPLYKATGNNKYLEASKLMVEATEKLLELDVVIQQDYFKVLQCWKDFTCLEAGFGMEGIAETFLATDNSKYKKIGQKYLEQLLGLLEREDGLWDFQYSRHSRLVQPIIYYSRGMGWAIQAVTSAYRMNLGEEYLEKSKKMANSFIKYQQPEGCWSYRFNEEPDVAGISEKGTAIWSAMLYRLYHMTGNKIYLEKARKALKWCIQNQYYGEDINGIGGISGCTPSSGVVYRSFFNMSCLYTIGFFILALLEELNIYET